ncbi:NnrS family protein [Solirhodobacter olei]|uniref:NnrS family protein n=1 Tax=Solirhodobacter olei TaxID=2493082 RepID=UPI000FDBB2B4|nr:NnrS family protein [Solirhodobacter olei]
MTTAEQIRAWRGPALFTYGFRPFFLGGAAWAALAMALWIGMLSGSLALPTAFDPVSWHAHEFLFGYLGAVLAGFLTTAVPNWTGRLLIVGRPLAALFALWVAGRVAVAMSAVLTPALAAGVDLAFPVVFAMAIGREIVAGRNWRNLGVLALLSTFILANALFHWEAAQGEYAAEGYGLRLGLAAALMMVALIGGRIVPSFTRNWLARRGEARLPAAPMQRYDRLALGALLCALVLWVALPKGWPTAALLALAGTLHLVRLWRWLGVLTLAEPLVWVLHAAYAFLPLGALAEAVGAVAPGVMGTGGQHLWMAGAVGLMTLAVMTRATLGHTGQALTAGPGTVAVYLALIVAVLARLAAGVLPGVAMPLYHLAGAAWIGAFAGYAILYGPLLLHASPGKRR